MERKITDKECEQLHNELMARVLEANGLDQSAKVKVDPKDQFLSEPKPANIINFIEAKQRLALRKAA